MFYNGVLVSAPKVDEPIQGGEAFLTGFATADKARSAINEINSGKLPFAVKIKSVEYSGRL